MKKSELKRKGRKSQLLITHPLKNISQVLQSLLR